MIGMTRINANGMNAARSRIADPWIISTVPPLFAAPFMSDAPVASVTAIASFAKMSATAVSVALRANFAPRPPQIGHWPVAKVVS